MMVILKKKNQNVNTKSMFTNTVINQKLYFIHSVLGGYNVNYIKKNYMSNYTYFIIIMRYKKPQIL